MIIQLIINGRNEKVDVSADATLYETLRTKFGLFGAKHGCETGECGACTVLLDGVPVNSCLLLAMQVTGKRIETIESIGERIDPGWLNTSGLSIIQQAFIDTGAIQCGFCTPAMILSAKSLLDKNLNPSENEVKDALSGVLCRCTGYIKPVQAILRAASLLRGEKVDSAAETGADVSPLSSPEVISSFLPDMEFSQATSSMRVVGKPEIKVDGTKLAQGKPAFTADIELRGMLVAKVLHSPFAHARIRHINTSAALALPGVVAVLTWKDLPRVVYSTAGQSDPIPGPLDTFSLDNKVRFVGDRVAFVAAETDVIAQKALDLIQVDYEPLPAIIDPGDAMKVGAPVIHDEPEFVNFSGSDPFRNLASQIRIDVGDVERGFLEADRIIEGDYKVPKVQQASIEPHVVVTYWDEDDRLVIRSSTQVPFHVRRQIAPLLNLPVKRIRVIKPRIGGGFGGKQEMLIEDVAAHLTIATGRPVYFEYTREEEFIAARSRHPMRIHMRTGVKNDGTITANEMVVLGDTGAYGCHARTVAGNPGRKTMALYVGDGIYRKHPNIRFYADVVYTNTPPSGAYRGYGVPQGFWAVERHMEKISEELGMDPLEFRLKNSIRAGEIHPTSTEWSLGQIKKAEVIQTCGLETCVTLGKQACEWENKWGRDEWHQIPGEPHKRRGIGAALLMQGTGISNLDMGSASIKINDDGSFNLLMGATDLGTGSDTVLAQQAAEVLGVAVEDIIVYSSDTDFTPFDKGAYASSTTYISGIAVIRAAQVVARKIQERAARMLNAKGCEVLPEEIRLQDRCAKATDGQYVTLQDVAMNSLHHENQEQIMGESSYVSPVSPPPFAAQFAEVTVDLQTGELSVDRLVIAVDSGVIVNPITASGQVEGGITQALGYAVCEEMVYNDKGQARETNFRDYHIFRADEMPEIKTIFVETFEPTHPFGVKAVAEIVMSGVAPAVGNAVLDACCINIDSAPITPEKVWEQIRKKS